MENRYEISIVSPVYQASKNINELVRKTIAEVSLITGRYEIVLVDDGSSDDSWNEILANCKLYAHVKGIRLSRNFGQHYAVTAGLEYASGETIVIMDCDLQDDPAAIKKLYAVSKQGSEIVFTRRINRKQSFFKLVTAKLYNLLFRFFSDPNYDVDAGSMVLFSARVKDIFLDLDDKDRLYIQLLKWIGFTQAYVPVEHHPRYSGRSSYNFFRLMNLAIQGWTSHSDRLLRISIYGGFYMSLATAVVSIYIIIQYILKGFQPGWPSLFIAILFSTGLILMSIGISGIYIGKIFQQTKNRPLYIIEDKINLG